VPVALALSASLALMAAGLARMLRRERRMTGELAVLTERMRELSSRM